MSNDLLEPLSVFLDGEVVDVGDLGRALDEPASRAFMLSAALARLELRSDIDHIAETLPPQVTTGSHARRWTRSLPARRPFAFAAMAGVLLVLGTSLGFRLAPRAAQPEAATAQHAAPRPPLPSRVVVLEVGKEWRARTRTP